MSRVDYVRNLLANPRRTRHSQIVGQLIQCLTVHETASLLDRAFTQPHNLRVGLLRRLARDGDSASVEARQQLLCELLESLHRLPSARRAACGSAILSLALAQGPPTEDEVIASFVRSPNGNLRKQALRRIKEDPTQARLELLAEIVERSGDFEAAKALVRLGSREELQRHFASLEFALGKDGYWLSRLYLALDGNGVADLARLRELDEVSWLYVCVKLQRPVDTACLLSIFANNFFEERSGLIVWCAGQLRNWDALVQMEAMSLEPPPDLVERHWRGLGMRPSLALTPPERPIY